MKTLFLTSILSVAAYYLWQGLHVLWVKNVIQHVTFTTQFELINTLQIALWLPPVSVYGLLGFFLSKLIKSKSIYWLMFSIMLTVSLEYFLNIFIFTNEATHSDKVWVYLTFSMPSLSLTASYILRIWLTRRSIGTALIARPHI